ncbi:MAG: ABC transporter ATP-binding protein, partial [Halobacteriaceae archaeon]
MINAKDFTFQYSSADEPALDEVSFTVDEGEVLGILGPVEAGKTTLSMALSGFVPEITGGWTHGELSVAGRDPREADDNRVAMVFEDYDSQLTQLRIIDEVVAPLTNSGYDHQEAIDRARELLDAVGLNEDEEKFTWDLSGGQQQRLAIAAALAIDPEVLIFDTATDMLDPEGRADVASLINNMAGEKTLVIAENDPDRLIGLADKLLVLKGGEAVAFGNADELLRDEDLLSGVGVGAPTCLEVGNGVGIDKSPITIGEFYEEYTTWSRSFPGEYEGEKGVETAAADGGIAIPPRVDDGTESASSCRDDEPVLEVASASYEYPDGTTAVSDVDLTVHEGEIHAIVGGNGAGKSTLSKLLVGLMNPTTGDITVDGVDTAQTTARDLADT